MTLLELYGPFGTPDEDELLWEWVGRIEYATQPFREVVINPAALSRHPDNLPLMNPDRMTRGDKAIVRDLGKIIQEVAVRSILVVSGTRILDGFHRATALARAGYTRARALDLEQPCPPSAHRARASTRARRR